MVLTTSLPLTPRPIKKSPAGSDVKVCSLPAGHTDKTSPRSPQAYSSVICSR